MKEKKRKEKRIASLDLLIQKWMLMLLERRKKTGIKSTAHVYNLKNPTMRTAQTSLRINFPKILSRGFFVLTR